DVLLFYLVRDGALLQYTREPEVSEKERDYCEGGQVHPPVGDQHIVLLEGGEEISPAGEGFGNAEAEEREHHFGQDELGDENGGLREEYARCLWQDVAAQQIKIRGSETAGGAHEVALLYA